jgi:hypothetical protein
VEQEFQVTLAAYRAQLPVPAVENIMEMDARPHHHRLDDGFARRPAGGCRPHLIAFPLWKPSSADPAYYPYGLPLVSRRNASVYLQRYFALRPTGRKDMPAWDLPLLASRLVEVTGYPQERDYLLARMGSIRRQQLAADFNN